MNESISTYDDRLLDRFRDLDYPGRKPPVNRSTVAAPAEDVAWDERSVKFMVNGAETEFFTISNLALALGRSVVTIRSWENKGLLPKTPFRSPRPRGETLPGTAPRGKRLWTRDQILGILQIAAEEKVILNGKPPTERFAQRVLALYQSLINKDSD